MVARSESMFGCYDSYSYRLWSLANVWNTCQLPPVSNGVKEGDPELPSSSPQPPQQQQQQECFIKCPQCQQGCPSFQALKEHMEACHLDADVDRPISPASQCVAGGPHGCSHCATGFATKELLEKHEMLHSPNAQVSCKICNKTFANVYRLQRHMISHDESAVLRKFKCTECDKAFKFKHHLKEHIRIHSGEKPFECGNCGKRFSHSGSYSSHMTSKKCLVMNLKLGRTRATPNSLMEKSNTTLRQPKRQTMSPMNNNITTSPNHNSYIPILPKYSEAAVAFLQSASALAGSPSLPPFYFAPHLLNPNHAVNPYTVPTLSHLIEQLQQQHQSVSAQHLNDRNEEPANAENNMEEQAMSVSSVKQEEDRPKSNASSCGELIMDEDIDEQDNENMTTKIDNNREHAPNSGDLEAVRRILETVNANVTKHLLQANIQKFSSESSSASDCQSVKSPKSEVSNCNICKKSFDCSTQLDEHECDYSKEDIRSEGLAAKLEDAIAPKMEEYSYEINTSEDNDDRLNHDKNEDEGDCESITTTDHVSEDGRKVRVRSLISEEQLKVLKDNYALNPRPKREDLEKIASTIGFPVRVVQVWFQNTRARDRREGRLIQVPYSPLATVPMRYPVPSNVQSLGQKYLMSPPHYVSEQPLDLSFKKTSEKSELSSPENSPTRPASENQHSEQAEEAVNLSRKSSRSPTPYNLYQNNYQNSNCSEPCQSPSPVDFNNTSRLAQILAQPPHKLSLPNMELVPMEQLITFGTQFPSLSQLISSKIASLSPNSERHIWSEARDLSGESADDDIIAKRNKVSQFVLKGLNSPVLGVQETEIEGQFSCDQCDKAFSKQSSLARHKYEHSGQRPHKCDECPKAFKHKHHLTEHKRLHSGEKPFQCSKCLKRFSHSGSYSQHMNHRYSYCKPYRE